MRVLLFGATGMVGQGALRECLLDADVESVVAVGRSGTGQHDLKLRELLHDDFLDFSRVEDQLSGFDACFFCLGVSSSGMSEERYQRITYGFTIAAAQTLARVNPKMTFIYVSGAGADSSERGGSMWARVRGKTENELLRMQFHGVYVFRPGLIVPLHGIQSRTKLYRVFYTILRPLLPLLEARFPKYVTTTEQIGRAMLQAARNEWPKRVLETADINACANSYPLQAS
ncbi:MAG: NAD-dependent epimerase/dehydratase family protein [Bryobacteraceae bacterium]